MSEEECVSSVVQKVADKLSVIVDKDHKECPEVLGRYGEA